MSLARTCPSILLAIMIASCGANISTTSENPDAQSMPDSRPVREAGEYTFDLSATAGLPCTYGKCAGALICMANICHTMCNWEGANCNDTPPDCPTGESCIYASSFTGACIKSEAQLGESCGAKFCVPQTLCVNKPSGTGAQCYKLAKYGCSAGETVVSTKETNCQICYKN